MEWGNKILLQKISLFSRIFLLRSIEFRLKWWQVKRLNNNNKLNYKIMATLSKSQIAGAVADKVGITKKQAAQVLDVLAELAYKNAKNTFTFPGVGKVVVQNRPARSMVMQFGPKKGQTVKVPAKRVLKFRFLKAAKDAILPKK